MWDTVALIATALYLWPRYTLGITVSNSGVVMCKMLEFLNYAPPCVSQMLIVTMTIERLLVTYYPYKVKKWLTPKTGLVIVGTVVAGVFMLYGHVLYGADLQTTHNVTVCGFSDVSYMTFFLATNLLQPLTFLLIALCNIAIVIKVIKSNTRIQPGVVHVPTILVVRKKQNRQILTMVLLVNMFCLVFNMPYIAYYSVQGYTTEAYIDQLFPAANSTYELLFCVSGTLFLLNNSLNFYLYVLSGSQFREDLKAAFC